MRDVRLIELAGQQYGRVARRQLLQLGMSSGAIDRRIAAGRLVAVEQGVFAMPPVLDHDECARWMAATLTHPHSFLSHVSAASAWGIWDRHRDFETITRPGNGGPRRHGGVLTFRSQTLEGETDEWLGIPITSIQRTLLDLSRSSSDRALARAVREAVRLERVTLGGLGDALGRFRGRRGAGRLAKTIARYSGLPLERARSGAEILALEILRDAGKPLPRLNMRIAGEEADLSWEPDRLIIEIDGGPFHLDKGEDARKEAVWAGAGWRVSRIASNAVYESPAALLAVAPS